MFTEVNTSFTNPSDIYKSVIKVAITELLV